MRTALLALDSARGHGIKRRCRLLPFPGGVGDGRSTTRPAAARRRRSRRISVDVGKAADEIQKNLGGNFDGLAQFLHGQVRSPPRSDAPFSIFVHGGFVDVIVQTG